MSGQQLETGWAIHSHMNHPMEKHRHLGASLLLTSSFAHHKQHLSRQKKQRMEQQANTHANYHQQVLQAKRINQARQLEPHSHPHHNPLSSIDALKTHARKLMDEQTTKLGKENMPQTTQQVRVTTAVSEHVESATAFKPSKRPNKRRIVKGRPEMYAVTRRRAFLLNLMDEEKPHSNPPNGIIQQLLNKNNLLKFISAQNERSESRNLYDNLERHKTLEEASIPKKHMHGYRKSLINFNERGRLRLQPFASNSQQGEDEGLKGQFCGLKKIRYSTIEAIQ